MQENNSIQLKIVAEYAHNMHTTHETRQDISPMNKSKRQNIYFRNPDIFTAFQLAIKAKIIKAPSASQRIEDLITAELRKRASRIREAKIKLPEAVFLK